jgi:hypothetical protein
MKLLAVLLAFVGFILAFPQGNPDHNIKDCMAFKAEVGRIPGPRSWFRNDGVCVTLFPFTKKLLMCGTIAIANSGRRKHSSTSLETAEKY